MNGPRTDSRKAQAAEWQTHRDSAYAMGNGPEYDGLSRAIAATQKRLDAAATPEGQARLLKRKWALVQRRQRLVSDAVSFITADPSIGLGLVE